MRGNPNYCPLGTCHLLFLVIPPERHHVWTSIIHLAIWPIMFLSLTLALSIKPKFVRCRPRPFSPCTSYLQAPPLGRPRAQCLAQRGIPAQGFPLSWVLAVENMPTSHWGATVIMNCPNTHSSVVWETHNITQKSSGISRGSVSQLPLHSHWEKREIPACSEQKWGVVQGTNQEK